MGPSGSSRRDGLALRIEDTYAPPTEATLDAERWALFRSLPDDHQRLLSLHNGGLVEPAEHSFETHVPSGAGGSETDQLRELFGLRPLGVDDGPRDLVDVARELAADDFLPAGVLAVGSTVQNGFVCVSLVPARFGEVLYWDAHWQLPWKRPFFQARIDAVLTAHADAPDVLADPTHPRFGALSDLFNFATLVTLAPSLGDWLASHTDVSRTSWL
ncbi:SMI1/KNR4 family protein [Myxococcota bacterium]|nr:SMI1/KNR4 family protein [Myxococcota bacterium]